jgi:RNA polymerase sigma factor (sigma-70 family)
VPDEDKTFAELVARTRRGDNEAAGELARLYEQDILLVARLCLGAALRPYVDSMDLVQSVHHSLLLGLRQNKFSLSTPGDLVALALTLVRRKVARRWRRSERQRRFDRGTDEAPLPPALAELESRLPGPEETAQYNDALVQLRGHLDPLDRQVIELRLEGHSTAEVARRLGLDADVLRVRLSRLRQALRGTGELSQWL